MTHQFKGNPPPLAAADFADNTKQAILKAPFPWFGGKSRVSEAVWKRFGNVGNYIEPFFGSGAVLLQRPHRPRMETVNDKDCFLANFWRAVSKDPEGVAYHACQPVFEPDLHARHLWLVNEGRAIVQRLMTDPDFYDVRVAGWWVWGISCWIGGGFCSGKGPHRKPEAVEGEQGVSMNMPYMSSLGQGVNQGGNVQVMPGVPEAGVGADQGYGVARQMPHLSGGGQGVSRVMPFLGGTGKGVNKKSMPPGVVEALEGSMEARMIFTYEMMRDIADRIRNVRVVCGEWDRILGPAVTTGNGITAVLLDPPYGEDADCDQGVYAENDSSVSGDVRRWAIEHGDDPLFRIALCGYAGEHPMPDSWEEFAWKATGGYGSQGKKTTRGKDNAHRERIWFSPHCLRQNRPTQQSLFEALVGSGGVVLGD